MKIVIDCSNNNGHLDLASFQPPLHFDGIIAKASEGITFTDSTFEWYREQAAKLKLPFGAYHFWRDGTLGKEQAEHFCSIVKKVEGIRPALDVELGKPIVSDLRSFSQTCFKILGQYPLFYSYRSFIEGLGLTSPVGGGLWLADYGVDNGQPHPVGPVPPWKHLALHQFTSKYGGHNLDASIVLQEKAVFRP